MRNSRVIYTCILSNLDYSEIWSLSPRFSCTFDVISKEDGADRNKTTDTRQEEGREKEKLRKERFLP